MRTVAKPYSAMIWVAESRTGKSWEVWFHPHGGVVDLAHRCRSAAAAERMLAACVARNESHFAITRTLAVSGVGR
jgi:hypothetical protein